MSVGHTDEMDEGVLGKYAYLIQSCAEGLQQLADRIGPRIRGVGRLVIVAV